MKVNCLKCQHYFITFDPVAPKGCRAYGIKSSQLPSVIIKQANNGNNCMGFKEKEKKGKPEKNLNDDKYWKA